MVVCGLVCLRACMVSHARCSPARVACIKTELRLVLRTSNCAVAWPAAGCTRMVSQSKVKSTAACPGLPKSRKSSRSLPCMSSGARRRAALPPVRSARKATCLGYQAACLEARRTWPDAAQAAAVERGQTSAPLAKPSRVRRTSCHSGSRVHSRWDSSCTPDSPSWQRVRLSTKWPAARGFSSLGTAEHQHKQHAQAPDQAKSARDLNWLGRAQSIAVLRPQC
jgi:hypothetical protein